MKKYICAMAVLFSCSSFGAALGNEADALKGAYEFEEVIDLLDGIDEVQESVERTDHQSFQVTLSYKRHCLGSRGPKLGLTMILVKVLAKKSTRNGNRFIKYDVIDVQKKSPRASSRRIAVLE